MSDNPRLDRNTYESSKRYLEEAAHHMANAGHKIHDFSDFALEKFGDDVLPYLEQFYRDIREGRIGLHNMTQPVKTAFFGVHVTPEERERMIRETAYLNAEQRGFSDGSDYDDWLNAERQVDAQLARSAGLVARGKKSVSSLAAVAEDDLKSAKAAVAEWVEKRLKPSQKAAPAGQADTEQPPAAAPKASPQKSGKKTAAKKADAGTAASAPKKKAAAKKSTAKKKAAAKKS